MRFSAIICSYDRYQVLSGAIGSLLAQSLPAGAFEIIVIDNSPDQAHAAAMAARYAGIGHLRYVLEPRPGLSNARNAGLALARGNIVGFIDDDAIASPGWAAAILDAFADFGGNIGAIGGPARPLWLADRPGWLTDALLGHLSILDLGPKPRLLSAGQPIMGCNMAFDAALLRTIGGFSPQLGRMGSEISLLSNGEPGVLNAVRAAGRAIGYAPRAIVDHCIDPSRLNQNWFRRRAAWQAVSDYLMDAPAMASHAPAAARYVKMVEASRTRGRAVGLFGPVEDGATFVEELLLVRELMIATLHGGAESEITPERPAARLQAAIRLRLRRFIRRSPEVVGLSRLLRRSLRRAVGVGG